MKQKKSNVWIVIYMFLAIFEPPFLPIPFIYVMFLITIILLYFKFKKNNYISIVKKTGILNMVIFFMLLLLYFIIITLIDVIFIEKTNLIINRLKSFNQLIVLTFTQFLNVLYLIILMKEQNYQIYNLFESMFYAGGLQGICAILAYFVPEIRKIFIIFADKELFSIPYFFERRGFGYSMTLIDTFGYGMGLLAGYLILSKWKKENVLKKIVELILIIFAILVNARTGVVIIAIAMGIKFLQTDNVKEIIIRIAILFSILIIFGFFIAPSLLNWGVNSGNVTVQWIAKDFYEMYNLLVPFGNKSGVSITNVTFLSEFVNLPSNKFELIFGTGHTVYDTGEILGFRTDIGYINLLWEFGIFGTVIILSGIFYFMFKPFLLTKNKYYRSIIVLNIASYFIVMLKAILIGYNPGVFASYCSSFGLYYFFNIKDENIGS